MAGRHNRRSIRLKGYDYTQPGAYFVTICTHERAHLFGYVGAGYPRTTCAILLQTVERPGQKRKPGIFLCLRPILRGTEQTI